MYYWSAARRVTAAAFVLALLWALTFWAMGQT